MSHPVVEILLASYNGERYIEAQIRSILEQSFQNFLILVRDDGSTDATMEIVRGLQENHPDHIRLISADTARIGAIQNFSELIKASTEKYLMFCDQDDIWLPDKIEVSLKWIKELETLRGENLPLLVHSDLRVVNQELHILHASFMKYAKLNPGRIRPRQLLVKNVITGSTVMFNRSLADLAAPIPAGARMHDWWLALAASCFGEIGFIDQPTALYRQHAGNVLGAKAYNFNYLGKKLADTLGMKSGTILDPNFIQAEAFLTRFESQLNPEDRQVVKAFINIQNQSCLQRRITLLKYGFSKGRVAQNLGLYLKI